jgi:DNA adenine methylase
MDIIQSRTQGIPILKWVGGKRQLQNALLPVLGKGLVADGAAYFEPFLGGGAMFFALQHPRSVVADVNSGLINVYKMLRAEPQEFIDAAKALEVKYNTLDPEEQKALYYEVRKNFNMTAREGLEQAVNFLFLNKAGFNGLYRENKSAEYNVPFGSRAIISLGTESNFMAVSESLKTTQILNAPYKQASSAAVQGDLVYFDPPYVPLTVTSHFTSYSSEGFDMRDQVELRDEFVRLDKLGVNVALTNSSAPAVLELYEGYNIAKLEATRNVSAKVGGRAPVIELLVTNF